MTLRPESRRLLSALERRICFAEVWFWNDQAARWWQQSRLQINAPMQRALVVNSRAADVMANWWEQCAYGQEPPYRSPLAVVKAAMA